MKKQAFFFLLFTFFLTSIYGLQAAVSSSEIGLQDTAPFTDLDLLVLANNEFGYEFYSLMKNKEENFIFSPYNLSTALQMVYAGSSGLTQSQIARILRLSLSPISLEQTAAKLSNQLATKSTSQDDLFLSIVNSLWVQEGHAILPAFKNRITKSYKGDVKAVNFQTTLEQVRKEINERIKIQTQGKIVDVLAVNQVSSTTSLLLVSALYMRDKWQTSFDSSLTRLMPFFPSVSKTLTVPTMSVTASFPYLKENKFAMLELPYLSKEATPKLSLYIILPNDTFGLESVERQLSSQKILNLSRRLQKTAITLSIPKFKISSNLSLKLVLEEMGLTAPFSSNANFSGIDGTQELQLTDVLQKGFLTVDENGSEAGLVGAIPKGLKSVLTPAPELFTADHPFLFILADKVSGTFLFMGRVIIPILN